MTLFFQWISSLNCSYSKPTNAPSVFSFPSVSIVLSVMLTLGFFYTLAAGTRTIVIHQDNEANRPVAPVTEESALLPGREATSRKKVFSFERFVFLWLGIGHFHCK